MSFPSAARRLPAMVALSLVSALPFTALPAAATPAPARPDAATAAVDLTATIRLSNCSATLVRYPNSVSTDRAMMLTNGHCFEGGFLAPGQVILNRSSTRRGTLLNAGGTPALRLTADRLPYGTTTAVKGRDYGQETYWFDTCVTASRRIDLNKPSCLLTRPGG